MQGEIVGQFYLVDNHRDCITIPFRYTGLFNNVRVISG